jgi:nucleotide-binding universal stress UspA family protein
MKILLAVDGSAYTKHMLAYLGTHEELFGPAPEFTAITVVTPVTPNVTHFLDKNIVEDYYRDEAEKVLKPVQAFAGQHQWNLTALSRTGHAGDVIAEMAENGRFDLVMMGSHGHGSIGALVLGSVAARVMARCKTPLLIIR